MNKHSARHHSWVQDFCRQDGHTKLIKADGSLSGLGSLISNLVDMDVDGRGEWDRHEHGTREGGTWDVWYVVREMRNQRIHD